jgi:hypothetical protein
MANTYGYIENQGTYADKFRSEAYPDNVVRTAGSLLLVANLASGKNEPTVATITFNSVTTPDTVFNLTSDIDVTLRKGLLLDFGSGNTLTVAERIELQSGTAEDVVCEDTGGTNPSNSSTAETWGMLRLLSPQALPLTVDNNNVDRKDYSMGLQGQEVKTRTNLNSSVQVINQLDDEAYHKIVLPASQSAENVYTVLVTGSQHAFGKTQVSGASDDNSLDEISRPSFDLMYQSPWALVGAYQWLDSDKQNTLNNVRSLAGLEELS